MEYDMPQGIIWVSVIVPVYNIEQYLAQCIESLICQSCRSLQIILVDDGSTDQSGEICDSYALEDKRIRVIHKENGGLVSARKSGLAVAEGKYIGFVDGDDFVESNMYENLLKKIMEQDVDFVHSGFMQGDINVCDFREKKILLGEEDRVLFLNGEIFEGSRIRFSIWSKLFKADLIRKAYNQIPDQCSYGEDKLCLCCCILECKSFYLYPEAFYHYRIREGSLSHTGMVDRCVRESLLYEEMRRILKRHSVYDKCSARLEQDYMLRLYSIISLDPRNGMKLERYSFGNIACLRGKRIVLYGAGAVGRGYYSQISMYTNCRIIAWMDRNYHKYDSEWIRVVSPDRLKNLEYDMLLIAVEREETAQSIKKELAKIESAGILSKIVWEKPVKVW